MRFVDIIEKKKHRIKLTEEEVRDIIHGYVHGDIPDYQISAFLMAVYFNGMDDEETTYLTQAMLESGDQMDLQSIDGVTCDKHSTGGVGDKTSLALAPMVAAGGAYIAKMSGRGLGHTGGTLDKLESIDGFQVHLDVDVFMKQVKDIYIAIMGQSSHMVPADQMLYALRDVTGTVDSLPLIASSIMSKKLASGADTILLDVKYGEGAFMTTSEDAEKLAQVMIGIGRSMHKDVRAILTDMNQPLGNAIGNALEVKEAIDALQGKGPADFQELCMKAGSIMLQQAHIAENEELARDLLQHVIDDGSALQTFMDMVKAQGGDVEQIRHPERLPQAKDVIAMKAKKQGYIHTLHAQQLGGLAMRLGAGRAVKSDQIDHSVGIVLQKKTGDYCDINDVLAYVHTNTDLTKEWLHDFDLCYGIEEELVQKNPIVYKVCE